MSDTQEQYLSDADLINYVFYKLDYCQVCPLVVLSMNDGCLISTCCNACWTLYKLFEDFTGAVKQWPFASVSGMECDVCRTKCRYKNMHTLFRVDPESSQLCTACHELFMAEENFEAFQQSSHTY